MKFDIPDWQHAPEFGPYLRNLRHQRRLKLKEAAVLLGVSFGYLGQVERKGLTGRRPNLTFLALVARTYEVPAERVYEKAGYRDLGALQEFEGIRERKMRAARSRPRQDYGEQRTEEAFRRLVLDPVLRPKRLNEDVLDLISPSIKEAWIEFAERLEKHIRDGGESLHVLKRRPLERQGQMPLALGHGKKIQTPKKALGPFDADFVGGEDLIDAVWPDDSKGVDVAKQAKAVRRRKTPTKRLVAPKKQAVTAEKE